MLYCSCNVLNSFLVMEDRAPYGKRPEESFTVYKIEVNPVNPEVSRVYTWKKPTAGAAFKMIPASYKMCYDSAIKNRDYYMIVHLKDYEDNICFYFINNEVPK
jgi:hypothetical protein